MILSQTSNFHIFHTCYRSGYGDCATHQGISTISISQSNSVLNLWFTFILKGSSSYGLPAPVAADYSQGNLCAPSVNLNFQQGNQTYHRVSTEIL